MCPQPVCTAVWPPGRIDRCGSRTGHLNACGWLPAGCQRIGSKKGLVARRKFIDEHSRASHKCKTVPYNRDLTIEFQTTATPTVQAQHSAEHEIIAGRTDAVIDDAGGGREQIHLCRKPNTHDIALDQPISEGRWPIEVQAFQSDIVGCYGRESAHIAAAVKANPFIADTGAKGIFG